MATVIEATIPRRVDLPGSDAKLDLSTVGGRIIWARFRQDMTQKELAKLCELVRPTIAAYESNRIAPPIANVTKLAQILKVSPSFIAFGEHGVSVANPDDEMINVPEITMGRDGEWTSNTYALPKRMIDGFAAEARNVKAFVLNHNAPAFNLQSGDRVFADASVAQYSSQHDMYLLRSAAGMEIIRAETIIGNDVSVTVVGPKGGNRNVKIADLDIIGAVVGSIRQN